MEKNARAAATAGEAVEVMAVEEAGADMVEAEVAEVTVGEGDTAVEGAMAVAEIAIGAMNKIAGQCLSKRAKK
ncbi:hypothetical protein J2P12_07725 [Candidatus Bathyarchaeota archaeon]|nr:hypothetical protein [Candidatus Bathyarchaeota archaeon]